MVYNDLPNLVGQYIAIKAELWDEDSFTINIEQMEVVEPIEELKVCRFCKHCQMSCVSYEVDCALDMEYDLDGYCEKFELNELLKERLK